MSLEAAIAENTAALKEVAALLAESNAGRAEALKAIKDTPAKEAKPRGRTPKGQTEETASGNEETSAPAPTAKQLSDLAQTYLATDDEAERKARLAKVREAKAGLKKDADKKLTDFTDAGDIQTMIDAINGFIAEADAPAEEDDSDV